MQDLIDHRARRPALLRRSLGVVLAALVVLVAACSNDDTATPATTTAPAPAIPFTAAEVRSEGGVHAVTWTAADAGGVTVYAGTDPEAVGRDRQVASGPSSGSSTVADLPEAPRWYFELVPERGEPLVIADRSLHLASAPNFRDIGGYRTTDGRWVEVGKVYRSDGLDELTPEDVARLHAIGVKLVCDLRTDHERESDPDVEIPGAQALPLDVSADDADVTQIITDAILSGDTAAQHAMLGDGRGAQLMVDGGADMVTSGSARAAYRQMYERLADPANLPAVFHCSAGKDRTGWAAASLLAALGVPDDVVFADYLESNDRLAASTQATLGQVGGMIDTALLEPVLGVRREYLESSFQTVADEHGSIGAYLVDGLGLPTGTIEQLREELLAG